MVREADKPLRGNYKESLLGLPDEIRSRVLMAAGARALANAAAACRSLHEYCVRLRFSHDDDGWNVANGIYTPCYIMKRTRYK